MSPVHGLGILTWEALLDAVRRRVVTAVAILSVLSLMVVDSCSGCATGSVTVNGQEQELVDVAGYSASLMFTSLGLWIITLAGVLGADHLTQTLEDGSAPLGLARPVGRGVFAFSRLFGCLAIVALAGSILLGATALLFSTRGGLPLLPAGIAALACALGSIAIAALAMTLSLYLPRPATWLAVVGIVLLMAMAGGFSAAPIEQEGWLSALAAVGPPLATSMVAGLGPWMDPVELPWGPFDLLPRLLIWDAIALTALYAAFRGRDIAT